MKNPVLFHCPISPEQGLLVYCSAGYDHWDRYNQINGVHYLAVNGALEVKDALYEFVTFHKKKQTIVVEGTESEFLKNLTDKDYGHYSKKLIIPATKSRKVRY